MKLPFMKLEGLGNCYVFADARKVKKAPPQKIAASISDVSTGIGADGLILVDTSREPYATRFYNKDGSEAEMCGNGLRQAALFIKKSLNSNKKKFTMRALAGNFTAEIKRYKGDKATVITPLGSPEFASGKIPVRTGNTLAFDIDFSIGKRRKIKLDCVSLGNPHAVIWVNNFDFDWRNLGQKLSEHSKFPNGVNVHFCRIVNSRRFQMRIYERGSGVTMACGSGAAACLAAGVMRNKLNKKAVAEMPGGRLNLHWDFSHGIIYQEGPVSVICSGEYYY